MPLKYSPTLQYTGATPHSPLASRTKPSSHAIHTHSLPTNSIPTPHMISMHDPSTLRVKPSLQFAGKIDAHAVPL